MEEMFTREGERETTRLTRLLLEDQYRRKELLDLLRCFLEAFRFLHFIKPYGSLLLILNVSINNPYTPISPSEESGLHSHPPFSPNLMACAPSKRPASFRYFSEPSLDLCHHDHQHGPTDQKRLRPATRFAL